MSRIIWLCAYVSAVLLANIFLDEFIKLPWFGLFSIGSIFFAAVFTVRDRLHCYGLKTVFLGIALALLANTIYAQWIANIPPRFIFASFFAILLSELADTAVFQKMWSHGWHVRVLASNAVSVPLDSLTFTLLAFAGVMSTYEMAQIVYADIIGKYLIAAVIAWLPFMRSRKQNQTQTLATA